MKKKIAIIGAGVSGAFFSYLLNQQEDLEVDLFDKSRGSGGRCAVKRYNEDDFINMGAQFLTNKRKDLSFYFKEIKDNSLLDFFPDSIAYFKKGVWMKANDTVRYVGRPHMNSFIKHWIKGINFNTRCKVVKIIQNEKKWSLYTESGEKYDNYDFCVFSLPLTQGKVIWFQNSKVQLPEVVMNPSWALLLKSEKVDLKWRAAFIHDNKLSWFHTRESKDSNMLWVIHTSPSWTKELIDLSKEDVEKLITNEVEKLLKIKIKKIFSETHLWRFASSGENMSRQKFALDENKNLAYIGDWFCGGRCEGAMESALECFQEVKKLF